MSTVALGVSDYPIRFKNSTGSEIPPFGLFRLESGTRVNNELVPHAELVDVPVDQVLYVNSAKEVDNDGYGWCRNTLNGPFWVTPEDIAEVAVGDSVGPVDNQTYVSISGGGFVVIFKDTDKELIYCDVRGGQMYWDAELTASLSAASNSKTGATTASAKLLIPDPSNPGDLIDGPTVTVTNRSLDATGLSGDYIQLVRIGNEWRPPWIDC